MVNGFTLLLFGFYVFGFSNFVRAPIIFQSTFTSLTPLIKRLIKDCTKLFITLFELM